jgi:LuxR family maltose regulon positive regulatory protein
VQRAGEERAIADDQLVESSSLAGALARRTAWTAQRVWQSDALYATRIALIVAVAYFVGAQLAYALTYPNTQMFVIWPPNVILLVAMLLTPRRIWWTLVVTALPAHLLATTSSVATAHIGVLFYAANVGQSLLTALLLQHYCGGLPRFANFLSTAWFIIFGAFLGPALGSAVVAAVVSLVSASTDFWLIWQTRFLTSVVSALTLIPPLMALLTSDLSRLRHVPVRRYLEAGLLALCLIATGAFLVVSHIPQLRSLPATLFLSLPVLLWAGSRFGVSGISAGLLITAAVSLWAAREGQGPFVAGSPSDSVLGLRLFLIVVGIPLMLMAALLDERRTSIAALRKSNEQIHRLASQLITAQEEERRRVARELHDEVGQALTTVKISLDTLRLAQGMPDAPAFSSSPMLIEESTARVDRALEQVRNLSLLLRPAMLDDLGLIPALRWLAHDQAQRAGYRVMFTADALTSRASSSIETVCYRVAQEALTNIARHAQASNVFIRLQLSDGQLRLTIRDDGAGFDAGEMRRRAVAGSSMGVLGMEERAILVDGTLTIQSLPGRGTTLELRVPYVASPEPDIGAPDALPKAPPASESGSGQPSRQRDDAAAPALLKTKFHAPRADQRWLARPRLLGLLDKNGPPKIVLISAPAGFGKTTLIGQWLAQHDQATSGKCAAAWLSLEASDNSPERFFGYLIAAIRDAVPLACAGVTDLISGASFPPLTVVTDALLNDLAALPGPFAIVLEDYHVITDARIHAAMGRVLDQLPPGMAAVVASREAPSWTLSRMRAAGRVVEVNAVELAFTLDEARALLGAPMARAGDIAQTLHQRTEGWPLGLQLARIALHDQPHTVPGGVNDSSSADRYTVSYLVKEVLLRQPDDVQHFLLTSALAEQFCASLCDVLRGREGHSDQNSGRTSEDMLAWLEQRNLFLVPLDDKGTWYRYHHLFRDALLQQLHRTRDAGEVERLHMAASGWFESRDLVEQAVRHAVEGGQAVRAARMVERSCDAIINQERLLAPTIGPLLNHLPTSLLQSRPMLLVIQAQMTGNTWDTTEMASLIACADAQLAQPPSDMDFEAVQATRADLDCLRTFLQFQLGELSEAVESSMRAQRYHLLRQRYLWAYAQVFGALARGLSGDWPGARQLLGEGLAKQIQLSSRQSDMLLAGMCGLELFAGNPDGILRSAVRLVQGWPDKKSPWVAYGHYYQGVAHLERFDLDAAAGHFQRLAGDRHWANTRCAHEGMASLAWVSLAQGDAAGAWAWAQQARAFAEELNNPHLRELAAALEAGLALRQGDLDAASQRLGDLRQHAFIGTSIWPMEPRLRRAQVQIARSDPRDLAAAMADLQVCLRDTERVHNARQAIEIRALLALGLNATGETDAALVMASQAVGAAAPQGFIRPFVELGPPMDELLAQLAASAHLRFDDEVRLHLGRIQAAFDGIRAR